MALSMVTNCNGNDNGWPCVVCLESGKTIYEIVKVRLVGRMEKWREDGKIGG